jgi:hypothetical protein
VFHVRYELNFSIVIRGNLLFEPSTWSITGHTFVGGGDKNRKLTP